MLFEVSDPAPPVASTPRRVPGSYLEVDPQIVEDQWKERGRLFDLMSGYLAFLLSQTALAAACNAVHVTTSRTARWLLTTHDRVDTGSS